MSLLYSENRSFATVPVFQERLPNMIKELELFGGVKIADRLKEGESEESFRERDKMHDAIADALESITRTANRLANDMSETCQ